MRKYYATRSVTVDGRHYNLGDIVFNENDLPGLRRAEEETVIPVKAKKRYPINELFCKGDPEISVVITFHNQERFVDQCLDSFRRQTFNKPYEIIAVIDASDQLENQIIKKDFSDVKVFKVNFGNANKARNFGMKEAKGKFLAFFDGDDYVFGEYLSKIYQKINETGADFAYARFEHDLYGQSKGDLPRCNIFEWSDSWADFSPITNTPIIIDRLKAPEWDERLEIMQDAGYCLKLKKLGLKGVHVREELWHYRYHDGGIWKQPNISSKKQQAKDILMKEYGYREDKAEVTFISLISRDVVLDEYFGQIKNVGLPKRSHWFILVDSNQEQFINKIKEYQKKHEKQFMSSRMFVTGEDGLAYSKDFEPRGMRIANFIKIIINQAASLMGGSELLFMIEDDTLVPKNAFKKLLPITKLSNSNVYVSGVECGRGYTKHTGICWLKKDEKGEIIGRTIPSMKTLKGNIEIGGGGWYCWIGRARELQNWTRKMPMRCFDGKMLGPDVMMCHDLKEFGLRSICNTTVHCSHYDERRKVWLPAETGKGYDIDYYKDDQGMWKMHLKCTDEDLEYEWSKPK